VAEPSRALPPESPLDMPRQSVGGVRRAVPSLGILTRIDLIISRFVLFVLTSAITGYGVYEAYAVMDADAGLTILQWVFLVLFAISFGWVAFSAAQVMLGFPAAVLRTRRQRRSSNQSATTAILIPVYNEEPTRIAAAVAAMAGELAAEEPGRFAVFLLADTNRAEAWIGEEAVFSRLIAEADGGCPVYYRRRRQNTEKKAGNIADWVERWGGAYEAMLVLDADSVMGIGVIRELARRMGGDPGLGLLQTIPRNVRARTLFGRLQQFANRCYGPVFAAGLGFWHGCEANYWGHNAIIRTRAFAQSAKLPLRGHSAVRPMNLRGTRRICSAPRLATVERDTRNMRHKCGPGAGCQVSLPMGAGLPYIRAMDGDHILDARGLRCPLPVLRARKALLALPPGAVLHVLTDDPVAVVDLPHFCAEAGHDLLEQADQDRAQRYIIRRGPKAR
jgi:membrane glycosyltransferase/TusA-related sulfurtransferase